MAKKISKKTETMTTTPVEKTETPVKTETPETPVKTETSVKTETPVKKVPVKKVPVKKVVKKTETAKTKTVKSEPVVETTPVVEEPVVETTPVVEEKEEQVEQKPTRKTKKITKEDIQQKWDELFEIYKNELKVKKTSEQTVSLLKFLTSLKNDTFKALKLKTRNISSSEKSNSGFMKPVNVSDELRDFIDINNSEDPITRVLITQKLCQYIKENKLQKPEDKREIIPDEKMKKLFDIQPNESEKLTYYSMQRRVQRHIFKLDV